FHVTGVQTCALPISKLLDVEVDHLHLVAFTPDGDLALRTVELDDSQGYQAAQPENGVVPVTGLVPDPGLTGLLKLGNGRSRRDTRGPPPLGNVVNPADGLHVPLHLKVQLEQRVWQRRR